MSRLLSPTSDQIKLRFIRKHISIKSLAVEKKKVERTVCVQGCQIFFGTTYQNGQKCTKTGEMYKMAIHYAK
jgi:hypothetical protein